MNEDDQMALLRHLGEIVRVGYITPREAEALLRERLSPDRMAAVLRAGLPEHKPDCARTHPPGTPCYRLPPHLVPSSASYGHMRIECSSSADCPVHGSGCPAAEHRPQRGSVMSPYSPMIPPARSYRIAYEEHEEPAGWILDDPPSVPPTTVIGECRDCRLSDILDSARRCTYCAQLANLKAVPLIVSHHELPRMPWPLDAPFLARFWVILVLLVFGAVIGYAAR